MVIPEAGKMGNVKLFNEYSILALQDNKVLESYCTVM